MNICYIGGSPCSGKSTVAEILSQKYGLYYFKADDFLERYIQSAEQAGYSLCKKAAAMTAEQTWMREPDLQCREEFGIYREIFAFVTADLEQLSGKGSIITEGAAYIPELIKQAGISGDRYISITPTADFQVTHYRKRDFVPLVLEGCHDKEAAFLNWMDRDILFAQEVRRQCRKTGYRSIVNDGSMKTDELAALAAEHFGF